MSSNFEDFEISLSVTPLDNVEAGDSDYECSMFGFDVEATFTEDQENIQETEDGDFDYANMEDCFVTRQESIMVERRNNGEASQVDICNMLYSMGIPPQQSLIDRIINDTRRLGNDKCLFQDRKVVRLRLSIDVPAPPSDPDEDGDEGFGDDDVRINFVPAIKSSVEGLKKVKVEGFNKECMICLEEILVGFEATQLPCSHLYHCNCVGNWLEKSGVCPLCRFKIV